MIKLGKFDEFGLLENKLKVDNVDRVMKQIKSDWKFHHNLAFSPVGRIIVLWNPCIVNVQILGVSMQAVHCLVDIHSKGMSVFITFVYAANQKQIRNDLWNELRSYGTNVKGPWLVTGTSTVL